MDPGVVEAITHSVPTIDLAFVIVVASALLCSEKLSRSLEQT